MIADMPRIHDRRFTRNVRAVSSAVTAARGAVLLVLGLLAAACGGPGLESPEAVFERVRELNAKGEIRRIWDLYPEQEQRRRAAEYEGYKEFLRKNPREDNRQKCIENYRVDPEQLMQMSAAEIFVQQVSEPTRRAWLVGARILSKEPAPDVPDAVRVRWETAQGVRSTMLTQYVDGGWYLITLRE